MLGESFERPHLVPDFADLVHLAVAARQVALDDLDASDSARQLVAELFQRQQVAAGDGLAGVGEGDAAQLFERPRRRQIDGLQLRGLAGIYLDG